MASLADAPDLVGFFSYSREDDEGSGGRLSKLRERIQEELRGQLGRTKKDFRLWQDKTSISHGELWENNIKKAVSESVFFIPIITPTAVKSRYCKFEFETFLAREKELDRSNLLFPILYIPVPALMSDEWREDPLLAIIGSRQYEQWQSLRHLDPSSTEVALRVEKLCENICKALQQTWLSPKERQEVEARRVVEEERRRQEGETKHRLDEPETQKRHQDKEWRKLEKEAASTAKKAQGLYRWRGTAAAIAAVVALLLVGGIAVSPLTCSFGGSLPWCGPRTGSRTIADFEGEWKNTNPNSSGITRLSITQKLDKAIVRAWGACHPSDCEWGAAQTTASTANSGTLQVEWKKDFATTQATLTFGKNDRLEVRTKTHFLDSSGRPDYESADYFERS